MPVTGQLWWTAEGDPFDARLVYLNSDGSNQTVEADNDPAPEFATGFVQDVGVDTAAGFFFALVNNGNFGGEARLVRGTIGSAGPTTVVADFGVGGEPGDANFDDIIVNALHVDVFNQKIYVSYQDPFGTDSNTGIRQFGYDPLTGAVVDEGFLVRADLETNKEIDPDVGVDVLNARDFELDLSSNTLYFVELFAGGLQEQGLYRMDLTTKVITQMVSSTQFPDDGSNGFIIDVEVDPTTGLVYFTTQSQTPVDGGGYNAAHNAIWYVPENATDAIAVQLVLVGLPLGSNLYAGDMVFDHDQRVLYVETEEAGGSSTDEVIYVFQLDALGATATLINTISPSPAFSSSFANIQGMAFNAIPYLLDVNDNPAAATEQGAAVDLLTGAPTITDIDGSHLASATVAITGGTFAGSDLADNLGVGAGFQQAGLVGGTNITVTWNQATSTLTLTGYDTLGNYELVMGMVRYQSTGTNPTNGGANPTRTITWTASDGALGIPGGERNSATTTLDITAVDDDPVNTVGGPYAVNEDASAAITGLSVSDADSGTLTVTLSAGRGSLLVDTSVGGGVTAGQVTGNGTGSVTITASVSAINTTLAAMNGVVYTPTANVNGADTLTMTSDSGDGDDTDMAAINVAAVNDAPTVAGDGTEEMAAIVEDMPSPVGQTVSSLFAGQFSDAADQVSGGSTADAFAGVAVTANGSSLATGQWQYFNGLVWVNIGPASNGAAVLLAASTSVRFNPALDFTGNAPTLTVHLVDGSAGAIVSGALADLSITGGTTRYSTGTVTLSQEVTDFNDAPTGVTGTLQAPEDANNGSAVGTLTAQDPDSSGPFTFTLLNNAGGRFAMDANGNVTVADGLLLDYEQQNSHTIRVRVTDDEGASSEFDVNVGVLDVLGENVAGDGRDNTFWGGAEADTLNGNGGNDTLKGGGGIDTLNGGNGNDILDGGAGADIMSGGSGGDIFIFRKGEANGDLVLDFKGQGSGGDEVHLFGYAAGTTFTRVGGGNSDLYKIDDHGFVEYVTLQGPGHVPMGDVHFFP